MKDEWTNFCYEEASVYMDTAPQEDIADHIAYHYLGRYWPTHSEKVDIKEFVNKINDKIKKEANQ